MRHVASVKAYIDQTTMYRTVLYSLMALTVWSLVFSVVGVINFFVVAMVMQLIILLAVGYCADRLLAWVYKTKPNPESVFVTSFILYFLLLPTGSVQSFVLAGLAALLAAVSKYLLVWRGRHVFNPAAISVVLLGLAGIGYAGWWVATPWLLPVVLPLGMAVLYKTRRLDMAGIYVAVSFAMVALLAIVNSTFTATSLWIAITSYPILFLAFFMLTEPQTTAPRRRQRNFIAVGIAVLAHSQLVIGPIGMTPELALVIGNIASAVYLSGRSTRLTLQSRRKLAGDQVEYVFSAPKSMQFNAGQYMELHIPHAKPDNRGVRRMFTIASAPNTATVSIITRRPRQASTYKRALERVNIGSSLRVTGIWGDFVLPTNVNQKLLFIAGGVGVTPFLSHLEWLLQTKQQRDIIFVYAVARKSDAIDIKKYQRLASIHVHEGVLDRQTIMQYTDDVAERQVYVSGPPAMVDGTVRTVRELGARSIHRDFFGGY